MKSRSFNRLFVLPLLIVGVFFWLRRSEDVDEKLLLETLESAEAPQTATGSPYSDLGNEPAAEALQKNVASLRASNLSSSPAEIPTGGSIVARFFMRELEEVALDLGDHGHTHKLREWKGRLSPGPDELEDLFSGVGSGDSFYLVLPDSTEMKIGSLRSRPFGAGRGGVSGEIEGNQYGEFVLSYANQALAGSIRNFRNGKTWEIRNAGGGLQFIAEVDVEALGTCAVCSADEGGQ